MKARIKKNPLIVKETPYYKTLILLSQGKWFWLFLTSTALDLYLLWRLLNG